MKKYNIVITGIDGDKSEVLCNETLNSVMCLGECGEENEGKCAEILMGLSTMDMATLIAASRETYKAAKIGCVMRDLHDKRVPKLEDDLINKMMGGLQ